MVTLDSETELAVGDEAPDFELPGTDGETHTLASFAEYDALLLVVTCNHCPYAKAKFDELNRLADSYDDLAVVGVNPNDDEAYPDDSFARMRELVADGTVDYTAYLRDEAQTVPDDYRAVCTPDPFLLANDDGTFRLAYHGRLDDALDPDAEPERFYMREAVEAVLAGEAVPFADEELPSRGCSIKWTPGNEPEWWNA
jgi:thiol-disulfide isomerase/thioredoxin